MEQLRWPNRMLARDEVEIDTLLLNIFDFEFVTGTF